ncbi:efflux RND transporter periplasmic adaptor subunit [Desulfomarina sp.]
MKKLFLVLPLIITLAAGIVLLKKRQQAINDAPLAQPIIHPVSIVAPENRTISSSRFFLAVLESKQTVKISSKLSGRITNVYVKESQPVKEKDPLFSMDEQEILATAGGLRAQLESAEAQLDFSRAQHNRNRILFNAGGLAREKFDASGVSLSRAETAVKELQQKIKGVENQLRYTRVTAPFNGIIGTVFQHRGDLATPGRPVLSLNSLSKKLTFTFVPGKDPIQAGRKVEFPRYTSLSGRITKIYDDARRGLSIAEIEPEGNFNLPNGSAVNVSVTTQTATGCSVPVTALLHRNGTVSVMVWQDNHFSEQVVHILARSGTAAVITPPVTGMVAVASEAKLSLLPSYGHIRITSGVSNE